jgi:hypothetical protein
MKREKARLEELRSMPYEDYLETPEWQETQKVAIKRAGNQCQVCNADGVTLNVLHRSLENLGCEQEVDVITLCEACYDLLNGKLVQGDDASEPGDEQAYPDFSFTKKAAVFVPSAIIGLGLPALLHAPLPAELFGLIVALLLARNSPKLYAGMRESLPTPLVELLDRMEERKRARVATGAWSNWDRLWGRHLYEDAPQSEQDNEGIRPSLEEIMEAVNCSQGSASNYRNDYYLQVEANAINGYHPIEAGE